MQITAILGDYSYSKILSDVSDRLSEMFKGEVSLHNHFCLRHQRFAQKRLSDIEKDIRHSEIILLNMVFDEPVLDLVEKLQDGKTIVIMASTPRGIKLTQMGSFRLEEIAGVFEDSRIAKVLSIFRGLTGMKSKMEIRKMLTMADSFLKILRFGKWKDARNYIQTWKYVYSGGFENMLNLFLLLLAEYYNYSVKVNPPAELPLNLIIHPKTDRYFTSVKDYLQWYKTPKGFQVNGANKKPLVGILFYQMRYQNKDIEDLRLVVEKLEQNGIGVVPVIPEVTGCTEAIKKHFMSNGRARVDAIISFLYFRLEGGPLGGDYESFEKICRRLNVLLINYLCMGYTTNEKWKESEEGMAPIEMTIKVIMPELDGLIEGVLVSGGKEPPMRKNMIRMMTPIEDRVNRAVGRSANWLRLRYLCNKDKRVAIILFNYPPGKDNLGNVGNLDTFESLIVLLDRLKDEGYTVSGYPRTQHEFIRLFTKKNVINIGDWTSAAKAKENSFKVPVSQYQNWFNEIPLDCQKNITGVWGKAPGMIMADEDYLYVPGLLFGNIFIGFQPPRGYHEFPAKTYHDSALPPHHQYLAFYRWVDRIFQVDVVIHFGTHGTLEFLPGKHVALSGNCYPDILIGNLPNLYVYTCSNPSEAVIAKRRSYAATVNHMIPPMMISDLYGIYAEMESELQSYYQQRTQSPARAKSIKEKLLEMAKDANLVDIEATEIDVNELYHSLNEMKSSLMTKGLHVLGRPLQGEELTDFILGIVRFDRGELVSLHRSLAAAHGLDWDIVRKNPSQIGKNGKLMGLLYEEINHTARTILSQVLEKDLPVKEVLKRNFKVKPKLEDRKDLEETLQFAQGLKKNLQSNHEIEELVKGLSGRFISPGMGGDPFRSPGVLPTARNIYQFNPDLVPTPLACERGVTIAEQVLENYKKGHEGRLPDTVGIVLWGFETMKTQGETVAEIFHLLGVRPKRSGIGDVSGIELIPQDELGRPRVDVLTEICGIFRDTFPVLLSHIDSAYRLVASLDEPEEINFVRKHALAIQKFLENEGIPRDQAEALSKARIFGPSTSNYGTDVTNLIETSEWQEEDQIADLHIHKMAHIYGDAFHGFSSEETFKEVLETVDVVAQVKDNEEYGITDLDHYYEFLGGLSKSAESVRKVRSPQKKAQPLILVANSTRDVIKTQDLKSTVNQEARSKLLNPKWIKGQTESGYRGVKNLTNRVEYLLGWQATAGSVDNWVWSEMASQYVFNEEVRKRMIQENIWAVEDQLRRLMEAYQRGMWDATNEEIEKLKQIYLELEAEIEELGE